MLVVVAYNVAWVGRVCCVLLHEKFDVGRVNGIVAVHGVCVCCIVWRW